MRWSILALCVLFAGRAGACEIGGCGFGPDNPAHDREMARANRARMLRDLEGCKAGLMMGSVCHGYCRSGVYVFDRTRFCDAYDNFLSQK